MSDLNHQHGPGTAIGVITDVTQRAQIQAMIERVISELGGELTVMVANAGFCQIKEALDLTPDDIRRVFEVNFVGLVNCYTLAAKQMIAQSARSQTHGTLPAWRYQIIGASSIVAFKPFPFSAHYNASKWAVRGFTHSFALEMAKYRIAVNAYAPGVVATRMWDQISHDVGGILGEENGSSQVGAGTALMGRQAHPEDIANVVAGFLASSNASFINGQTIVVDGGVVFT